MRLADYHRLQYKFSYLRTQDGVEIDLIVERPGKAILYIEIKSSENIRREDISSFIRISKDFSDAESICICNEEYGKRIEHVWALPWREALKKFFTG